MGSSGVAGDLPDGPRPTLEQVAKSRLAAWCVTLMYRVAIRTRNQRIRMDDTHAAAAVEFGGLMERPIAELLDIERDLTAMLTQCGGGFSDAYALIVAGVKVNPADYCAPVKEVLEARRAERLAEKMEVRRDLQAGDSTRSGA